MANFRLTVEELCPIKYRGTLHWQEEFRKNSLRAAYEQVYGEGYWNDTDDMANKKLFNNYTKNEVKSVTDNLSLDLKESRPETKSKAMNREDLAREVVDLLGPNEMVFGTYVRDQIAKKPTFREMSVFLNTTGGRETELRNKFITRLNERFGSYSTSSGTTTAVTDNGTICHKQRIKLTPNGGPTIEFDLVTNDYNDPFVHAAADIEAVGIKNGQLVVKDGWQLSRVKENITNKVYEPILGKDSLIKTNKLREDGYTPKGEKEAEAAKKVEEALKKAEAIKAEIEKKEEAAKAEAIKKVATKAAATYFAVEMCDKKEEPVSMMTTFKAEAQEAAYRVAAAQMVKGVKAALVKGLQDKKAKKSQINAMRDLLDSELGTVMISEALGYALKYVPGIKEDPRAIKLSEEFRIAGMATAGNLLVNELVGVLLPVLTETFKALPAMPEAPKVEASKEEKAPAPIIEDLVVQQIPAATVAA
jgi:hypothetical protein